MKLRNGMYLALAMSALCFSNAHAVIFAGEDFDGGTVGGFTAAAQTLDPDNTAFNGLFNDGVNAGSIFDRFGITMVDADLPNDVVDATGSDGMGSFPADTSGLVSESKTDKFFMIVDVENSQNLSANGRSASASWDFDITGEQNLSFNIDMGMLGDFGSDSRGILDTYDFQYSIDGAAPQPLMLIQSQDIDTPYTMTLDNGTTFFNTGANFFYDRDGDQWGELGCVPGTPGSCNDNNGMGIVSTLNAGDTLFIDPMDVDADGAIYFDPTTNTFTDAPSGVAGEVTIRTYEETNGSGTFSNPEVELLLNPLVIDGDASQTLTTNLETYTKAIPGTGSTLTISLDVEQVGGDQYLIFDNLAIDGTPITGGSLNCDADGDMDCEQDDINAMFAAFGTAGQFDYDADGTIDADDISGWLAEASTSANLFNTSNKTYVIGDADLDGDVDSTDLGLLLNNFNSTVNLDWLDGNMNGDSVIDSTDLGQLLNNFNFTSATSVAAVPEPNTAVLLTLALFAVVGFTRRR